MATNDLIFVGVLTGIGGTLIPGVLVHFLMGGALHSAWTVTAPVVFAVAIVVLCSRLKWVQSPISHLCLTVAVFAFSLGFTDLAVRLGALAARWLFYPEVDGSLRPATSFAALAVAHYAAYGAVFFGLAVAIGVVVGLLWSRLLQADPSPEGATCGHALRRTRTPSEALTPR